LPHFVNSFEWRLEITESKTFPHLNLILYVPKKTNSPLYIKNYDGTNSNTNAFIVPQWGGIVIYNELQNNSNSVVNLKQDEIPMWLFLSQLRELMGLYPLDETKFLPNPESGISEWEVDSIARRYTFYNINSTIATLTSLSKLIQTLTNIAVGDNIGGLCVTSMESLEKSIDLILNGKYDEALAASKIAVSSSEEAFFDPNMLSLLYFPEEHKYAIYALPFAPIIYQLLMGLYYESKNTRQNAKKKKEEEEKKRAIKKKIKKGKFNRKKKRKSKFEK